MIAEIERTEWSIVLMGSFNPTIFHPAWLQSCEVISKATANSAETEIIHDRIAVIKLSDIRLNVEVNRFQILRTVAPEISILDMTSKIFGDQLSHSPITDIGVNKTVHFRASSAEKRIELGRKFAPLDCWGEFGKRIDDSSEDQVGGLIDMRMREIIRDDDSTGHLECRIGVSDLLDRHTGIVASMNRHFHLNSFNTGDGALKAMTKLTNEFQKSIDSADEVITHLTELAG